MATPTHVKDLVPDPENRRTHNPRNLGMVVDALHQVGAARSIVIDEDNVILAGNGVTEAAAEAGITKVQVIDVDGETLVAVRRSGLTPEQKRALAIYDNRTAELAEWNAEQLQADVANGLSLQPWFSEDEASALLAKHGGTVDGLTDPDAVPEERPTSIVAGDLFKLGRHRLLCGDSTSSEAVARLMDGQKADLCFTSPPYNLGSSVGLRNGAFKGAKTAYTGNSADADESSWVALMDGFMSQALQVSSYVAVNVQLLSGNKHGLAAWFGGLADFVVDVYVWVKSNPPPAMAEHVPNSAYEFVFVFSRTDIKPSRAVKTASFHRGTFSNVYQSAVGRNSHTEGQHGATFPVEFAAHYITNLSGEKSAIYEPFTGSGTSMIVAEQHGRSCYGMEIEPKYVQIAIDRWEAFTGQKAVKVGEAVSA
jgi:DNA modification methylase